ncbi:hypothetical protein QJS04_geneDACA017551 [Acorus gramineus]|uniref:Uncharacterized protein n=1 Tax=Acorus gramineus TaxID=55184 RepID=A0AAV9BLG9_ACOGR|nr:hypothetical protein QJS04_geneDACA017551 [Acorus gramineus]
MASVNHHHPDKATEARGSDGEGLRRLPPSTDNLTKTQCSPLSLPTTSTTVASRSGWSTVNAAPNL